MRVLKVLDQALSPRTFLVGESITLADLAVATAVLLPFKYVCVLCNTLSSTILLLEVDLQAGLICVFIFLYRL